uniref:Uncharacterized protein n=1 Tax=viral metagenome TaxID=1070528 RepID=A0A6C0K5H0_9ZZZZ
MQHLMCIFLAVLFFVLTPGILVTLPPKGSKVTVALTHAVVFAIIYCLTYKAVYSYLYEGFESPMCTDAKESGDKAKIKAACTSPNPPVGQR